MVNIIVGFVATVKCITGDYTVGDDVTVVDGSNNLLQSHCPVLGIVDSSGMKKYNKTTDLEDNANFSLYLAMWFPSGTVIDSLKVVKENQPSEFVPESMPPRPVINSKPKGLFKKLFG